MTTSLHISLPEALKEYVVRRVEEGAYSNPSEFVRELIRADRERCEQRKALIRDLEAGLDQAERGEVVDADEAFARLEARHG